MKGLKKATIKYEMKKYCKPTNKAVDLMHKVIIDFIKESCTRSNERLKSKKKVIVTGEVLSDAIGLK